MITRKRTAVAKLLAAGVLAAGSLSGCSGEKEVTITVPDVGQEAQQISERLSDMVDVDLPVDEQLKRLADGSKDLYCDAQGSPLAESIKNFAETMYQEIVEENPGVDVEPLDLNPRMCS